MKIVGALVVGPGEAERWLDPCLAQLHPLCDEIVVCQNNTDAETKRVVKKHRLCSYEDNREWGLFQPFIKEDLLNKHIASLKPDWILALDADEFFDKRLTRQRLEEITSKPNDIAYFFWCVELWDGTHTHNYNLLFEDIRLYKFLPQLGLNFKKAPVHGGIAPEYAYTYGTHSEFIFRHYGLLRKKDRLKKIKRYQKYDPDKKHLAPWWYQELESIKPNLQPFIEEEFVKQIPPTVFKPYPVELSRSSLSKTKIWKFKRISDGAEVVLDSEKHYQETKLQKGFVFLGEELIDTDY